MIDTMSLLITADKYNTVNYDFIANNHIYRNKSKANYYTPVLNLCYSNALKIQFSAPKLVFGNNFAELDNGYFDTICYNLQLFLKAHDIQVDTKDVINVKVIAIHFSKNLILQAPCSFVITNLAKAHISKRLDSGHTDYRNEGHAIRWHANSYEISFYDKIKDLQMANISEKRAIENDSFIQQDIYSEHKAKSVLRFECRFNKLDKIKDILGKVDYNCEITFKNLFNADLSRLICQYYWNIIKKGTKLLLLQDEADDSLLYKLTNLAIPMKDSLSSVQVLKMINNIGSRATKNTIGHTLYNKHKKILEALENKPSYLNSIFDQIELDIENFEPINLNSL